MLEWSTSGSEGEEQVVAGARVARSPSPLARCRTDGTGPVKSGEPRAARVPWREVQAEPTAASRCASTEGRRKLTLTADASDGGSGGAGIAPGGATPRCEQRPGPSRHGEFGRGEGLKPQQGSSRQTTRSVGGQRTDSWLQEACVLDFEEDSLEEGELIEEREEDDWWAQGGAGPANALSKSFQRPRQVISVVKKVPNGSQIGRRKAEERPPSLSAGEDSAGVRRVSVAVEAKEEVGEGAARLVKGVYVSDMGLLHAASLRCSANLLYMRKAVPTIAWFCIASGLVTVTKNHYFKPIEPEELILFHDLVKSGSLLERDVEVVHLVLGEWLNSSLAL
ncbi:hypothetical protein NDU88_001691 [Pleurodeles waltl]|uniref:Uncharacterized protein n=1 Tax=Pleurodeles waltl TaxID=8319 RepID=A0AAV7TIF5_PLEWA|nr:hypothetical protein NDU88_001691 [Pleurodeles waltl]